MNKILPFLLPLTLFFVITSCKSPVPVNEKKKTDETAKTNDASFPPPPGDDKVQTNSPYSGFDITAPEGWEKKDTIYAGSRTLIIFSPIEGASDDFRENLNVVTEKTYMEPKDYFDLSRKNMNQMLTNLEELDNGTAEINGLPAHWLHYTHDYQGYSLEVKAYVVMRSGMAYIITCTSKKGQMNKWKSEFEQAVNTFTVN